MVETQLDRNLAVLPMSVVRELTHLSDRQIRYYESQQLIEPKRSENGQRRFSLNDVEQLAEIQCRLASGETIKELSAPPQHASAAATDKAIRRMLADEFLKIGRFKGR